MKTDKISFGTKPYIGDYMAEVGLPKYKKALTEGILDAFEKLAKNGVNDVLSLHLGVNGKQKDLGRVRVYLNNDKSHNIIGIPEKFYNDVLQLSYMPEGATEYQSSTTLNPKIWGNFPKKFISKLIINTYKKLTKSNKNNEIATGIPYQKPGKKLYTSEAHQQKINELVDKFGSDDSGLLT